MTEPVSYWIDLVALDTETATFERTLGEIFPRLILDVGSWIKLGGPSRLVVKPEPAEANP